MNLSRRVSTVAAAGVAAVGVTFAAAPAQATVIGDGVTAPSHDESLAVINICKPFSWLKANFGDHGNDIRNFSSSGGSFGDVFTYALADAAFHLPATLATFGGLANPGKYCL